MSTNSGELQGISIWYDEWYNWQSVSIICVGEPGIHVSGRIDGSGEGYYYPDSFDFETWYRLKVDANGSNGEIKVYVNDEYKFTHTIPTPIRSGRSGLKSFNAGADFDNFKLTID